MASRPLKFTGTKDDMNLHFMAKAAPSLKRSPVLDPSQLSHRIGRGRTAEIFRLRDGRIVKLLSSRTPLRRAKRELRFAQLAAAAELPVWRLHDLVRCGERWGLLGEALPEDTTSLAQRLAQRPWEVNHWFQAFVTLHRRINATSGEAFPPIKGRLGRRIRSSQLPETKIKAALRRLRQLPDGDSLCHGDLHPGNLLVADGCLLAIDWASAGRGPAAFDVARSSFLLGFGSAPGLLPSLLRPVGRYYARRYAGARLEDEGITPELLAAWRLPIMAARLVRRRDSERAYFTRLLRAEINLFPTSKEIKQK